MKSGRELDRLIAEKIFGYITIHIETQDALSLLNIPTDPMTNIAARIEYITKLRNGICMDEYREIDLPHYSTDIAAAWEVLEKVCDGTDWSPQVGLKSCMIHGNFVNDWGPKPTMCVISQKAESAPHAICLAALKAMGVEV